jgi:hypothetical protein
MITRFNHSRKEVGISDFSKSSIFLKYSYSASRKYPPYPNSRGSNRSKFANSAQRYFKSFIVESEDSNNKTSDNNSQSGNIYLLK